MLYFIQKSTYVLYNFMRIILGGLIKKLKRRYQKDDLSIKAVCALRTEAFLIPRFFVEAVLV